MLRFKPTILHGNAVVLFEHGILITGKPQAGKTSLCVKLLHRGHCIIADDAVLLKQKNNQLQASAPARTLDKIADNSNHIYSISQRFGQHALSASHSLHFHVALDDSYQQSQLKTVLDQLPMIPWQPHFSSAPEQFELTIKNAIECHFAQSWR